MKWHAQVAHVARKDLHHTAWLVVAYAAVAALATLASRWDRFGAAGTFFYTVPLVVLGMILTAVVVQSDSPARSTALWVTLPLRPSAVLCAKILVAALVVVGLPLLGQLAVIVMHATRSGDIPGLLVLSALAYGVWLAIAAALAALTRDLRSFLVALILVMLAWGIVMSTIYNRTAPAPAAPYLINTVQLTGLLLLLAHQYLTRDVRRGIMGAAVLWLLFLALPMVVRRSDVSRTAASARIPASLRPAVFRMEGVDLDAGSHASVQIRLEGASRFHEYALVAPVVRLHGRDGSSEAVPTPGVEVVLNEPTLRLAGRLVWLGDPEGPTTHLGGLPVELAPAQREALARGGARLSVRGHLEVREPRTRLDLPLAEGATAASGGLWVKVARAESFGEGPSLEVQTSSIAFPSRHRPDALVVLGRESVEYALVNRRRGEALALRQGGSAGSSLPLMLPGPSTASRTLQLLPPQTRAPETHVDREWLSGASLVLVQWSPLGSDPVRIEGAALPRR
jgi:hypothetical protein